MKSFLLKGLVAGISFFILGWIVYGILLDSYMSSQTNPLVEPLMRSDDGMVWWAMILGNLSYGMLLAYILVKSKASGLWCHVKKGLIVGAFYAITVDLMMYSMMDMGSLESTVVDILVMTALSGVLAGLASFVGKGGNSEMRSS